MDNLLASNTDCVEVQNQSFGGEVMAAIFALAIPSLMVNLSIDTWIPI
jgi:hypothetical protein